MPQPTTADVRLDEHKAASFGPAGRASCRFGCQRVGCDRISLPRKTPRTEDRDQQLRYPGNVGLNEALRAHLAHRCPLCWHPLPRPKPKERTLVGRADAPPTWGHHPGMAGEIILERRAKSNRNAERDHRGFASDFPRNPHRGRLGTWTIAPRGARTRAMFS